VADDKPVNKEKVDADSKQKSGNPLIFISHDSRDAELAEAFSSLLSNVSMGMLESFRSSDRRGTEGIQYGDEWYKRLMSSLSEANDVVCLFTKRSLNRPWILFEAGVAKGTLSTPVYGLALGIPLEQVSTGPFYQFQNCQDDEDGLIGLVMQLIKKIPTAKPSQEAVGLQVKQFRTDVADILEKLDQGRVEGDSEEEAAETTSGAKLFEEIKVMVRDLPVNLEERISEDRFGLRRKLDRVGPRLFNQLMRQESSKSSSQSFGVLTVAALLREDAPWLYDLAMEVWMADLAGRHDKAVTLMHRLKKATRETIRHPVYREVFRSSRRSYMIAREFNHLMERFLEPEPCEDEEASDTATED